jgi:uncharacterized protein YqeY
MRGGETTLREAFLCQLQSNKEAREARNMYYNLCSIEEKRAMGNVQEAVMKKRKGTMDEEILRTANEWIPNWANRGQGTQNYFI